MNTEPPEGDDLQRMLVAMKRNVLDHATPRPNGAEADPGRDRRGRAARAGTATGAVALSLTQQDSPSPDPRGPRTRNRRRPRPRPAPRRSRPRRVRPAPHRRGGDGRRDDPDRVPGDGPERRLRPALRRPRTGAARCVDGRRVGRPAVGRGGPTSLACQWGASEGPSPGLSLVIGTGTQAQLATGSPRSSRGGTDVSDLSGGAERCSATDRNDEGRTSAGRATSVTASGSRSSRGTSRRTVCSTPSSDRSGARHLGGRAPFLGL